MDYLYRATVVRAIDGDTLDVRVDLGFRIVHEMRVRLYGVNTPERGQAGYSEAQAVIAAHEGHEVEIKSHKPQDKYGRWLAEVFVNGTSLTETLIAGGYGVPYFGGPR